MYLDKNQTLLILQNLKEVRALLSKPESWIKGYYARDLQGEGVLAESGVRKDFPCFCLLGAIRAVCGHTDGSKSYGESPSATINAINRYATDNLRGHVGRFFSLPEYNDDPDTKHEDILNLLDGTIRSLEEKTAPRGPFSLLP